MQISQVLSIELGTWALCMNAQVSSIEYNTWQLAWVLKHETQANKFNSQAKAINSCPFKVCDLKLLILRLPTAALIKYQKCKLPF